MNNSGNILVINPGSTSTKLGLFAYDPTGSVQEIASSHLDHTGDNLPEAGPIADQLPLRLNSVRSFLEDQKIELSVIMARSAPLHPMAGGVYTVNETMVQDLLSMRYSNHASNLAALMAYELAAEFNIPTYISDPITSDELLPVARISGVPEITRKSRCHALNIKASTRKTCSREGIDYSHSSWVVCHLGGGISVVALKDGKLIDVNDALLGMGPFSPERAGSLPVSGLLDLAYSGKFSREELETKLSKKSGLKGYLGTADLAAVETKIRAGNRDAQIIYEAMLYQISKEIAAMASVLEFNISGILLTGGMTHSRKLCADLRQRLDKLGQVYIEEGENEMEALAQAGFRVLTGREPVLTYESTKDSGD